MTYLVAMSYLGETWRVVKSFMDWSGVKTCEKLPYTILEVYKIVTDETTGMLSLDYLQDLRK